MTLKCSDYDPAMKAGAVVDAQSVTIGETLAVTGIATFAVAPVFTANPISFFQTEASEGAITVTAAQTGGTFLATKGSATQTYTLPAVAAGLKYTFICGHASGEILIDQVSTEVIIMTAFTAVGSDADTAIVTTSAGTGIKNTAATNAIGDSITLVSDGVGWYGVGIASGIWATQ